MLIKIYWLSYLAPILVLTLLLSLCTLCMWAELSTFWRYDYGLIYLAGEECLSLMQPWPQLWVLKSTCCLRDDATQQPVYIYKFKENCPTGIEKLTYTLIISTKYKIGLFHTENKWLCKLNILDINIFRTHTNNKFLQRKG